MPSIETARLRALLDYDQHTGLFTYRTGKNSGKVAGTIDSSKRGYVRIVLTIATGKYVAFYAHRLAWQYVTGEEPSHQIDHCNNVRSDNRWCNLRQATPTENQRNYPKPVTNKSGFKGVRLCGKTGRWRADIRVGGNRKEYLGHFDTPQSAFQAYAKRNRELFGEFSNIGIPANDNQAKAAAS